MKKLIISFLCLLFCNPVFAWVFSSEAVKKDTHAILLPRLLSGKPLEVCIHVRHNRAGRDCKDSACSDVYQSTKVLFEKAYNEWFLQLRRAIQQSNRSAEFKDILDMIPGQFSFVYLNGPQDNYKACTYQEMGYDAFTKTRLILYPVTALTEIGGHTTGGVYEHTDTNPPLLKFHYNYDDFGVPGYPLVNGTGPEKPRYGYSNRSSWSIILHELGHSLGLGDLYAKAAGNSYNSRSFTTSHIQPASAASSIMNESLDVDCDDFDGIINLMDHYYGEGKLKDSKRRTNGWVSLCANRNIAYAYGMPFEITPEEKAHFQAYVARNYVPEVGQADTLAAFSSKVKNVYQKTDTFEKEKQAIEDEKEKSKRKLEEDLAKKEADEKAANIANYNKNLAYTCPVCGKKVLYHENKNPIAATVDGKYYKIHVHDECFSRLNGLQTKPSTYRNYGKTK